MVEIFRTDLRNGSEGNMAIAILQRLFPQFKISLDLEDPDRVLRIDSGESRLPTDSLQLEMATYGYSATAID